MSLSLFIKRRGRYWNESKLKGANGAYLLHKPTSHRGWVRQLPQRWKNLQKASFLGQNSALSQAKSFGYNGRLIINRQPPRFDLTAGLSHDTIQSATLHSGQGGGGAFTRFKLFNLDRYEKFHKCLGIKIPTPWKQSIRLALDNILLKR